MSQEFVPDDNFSDRPNDASAVSEQEVVRITVVGSPAAVLETIHTLYRLGFAQVGDWSRRSEVQSRDKRSAYSFADRAKHKNRMKYGRDTLALPCPTSARLDGWIFDCHTVSGCMGTIESRSIIPHSPTDDSRLPTPDSPSLIPHSPTADSPLPTPHHYSQDKPWPKSLQ